MWFKKTPLEKLIGEYGKDQYELLQFAKYFKKKQLEDISLEDIKQYYTDVVEPLNSLHARNAAMKAIRKLFREYRGENILKADLISDNPLNSVEFIATIVPMKKEVKRGVGRPMDIEAIKKTVQLKDEVGLSLREIGRVVKKGRVVDHSQVYKWLIIGREMFGEVIPTK